LRASANIENLVLEKKFVIYFIIFIFIMIVFITISMIIVINVICLIR